MPEAENQAIHAAAGDDEPQHQSDVLRQPQGAESDLGEEKAPPIAKEDR